jgi:hypothetical protein
VRIALVTAALVALALTAQAPARESCTPGVHSNGVRGTLLRATVKLQGGRKRGTFSGTTLVDQKPGSGTFSC